VFAKATHKRAVEKRFTVGAHTINVMPARPYLGVNEADGREILCMANAAVDQAARPREALMLAAAENALVAALKAHRLVKRSKVRTVDSLPKLAGREAAARYAADAPASMCCPAAARATATTRS
jgi:hypothetical protein